MFYDWHSSPELEKNDIEKKQESNNKKLVINILYAVDTKDLEGKKLRLVK